MRSHHQSPCRNDLHRHLSRQCHLFLGAQSRIVATIKASNFDYINTADDAELLQHQLDRLILPNFHRLFEKR